MPSNSSPLYQKRIAVAMSGGVDSSVTAALLLQAGARVEGVFMRLAQPEVERDRQRAAAVAEYLGIQLTMLDLEEPFRGRVLEPFSRAYFQGQTPNPCVVCNRRLKFGLLQDAVLARGADFLATGHYVRLDADEDGGPLLRRGIDPGKDQSYFLCRVRASSLRHVLFPLGEKRKSEVYQLAAKLGLSGRHGVESQDICFMGTRSVPDFLADYAAQKREGGGGDAFAAVVEAKAGPIVTLDGRELGRHAGVHRYTVGQRRGLGLPDATPYYVVALDVAYNKVVVGKKEDLLQGRIGLRDLNWLTASPPQLPAHFSVQLRHRHPPAPALVEENPDGSITINFTQPQRAPAPGQYAALYRDDRLMGGGEIL